MANYFSIFLVILTVVTGLIWLVDAKLFAPKRRAKFAAATGSASVVDNQQVPIPYIVDTAQQIFPVIAFVLVLRSFLYEPFQIPSGSMMPTLLVGDFILVEKFAYGLKDPVARKKFVDIGSPERGDVAVFKFPKDPSLDYIKRVVGLPGDTVVYSGKQLFVKPACKAQTDCPGLTKVEMNRTGEMTINGYLNYQFEEQLGEVSHQVLINPFESEKTFKYYQQRDTKVNEFVVPEGHYFVMGDNRDNSEDGRFWGFVPDENLVGKAVAIWISFEFEREQSSWLPGWIPSGVRFERVGGID